MMKILARGAEAILKKRGPIVIKKRIAKGYRYPELDEKLRRLRTRSEARLLQRAHTIISTPQILKVNESEKEIEMSYIPGEKVGQVVDKLKNAKEITRQIGRKVARLHDAGIIHGDLTTSNILLKDKKVYIIDFGLGFLSQKREDKAVDLYVFKQALEAKHPQKYQQLYISFLQGYKISKNATTVIKQVEKVEKRGRYKAQY